MWPIRAVWQSLLLCVHSQGEAEQAGGQHMEV